MRGLAPFLLGAVLGCQSPSASTPPGPYVVVLGTAQDAGLPQIACRCDNCLAAREDPARARYTSSVLLVDPRDGRRWLFDATPDLPEQLELARGHGGPSPSAPGRPALFDGVFLTHAHVGHYTGLMYLGREAYGSESTPVYATQRLAGFLETSGPWDQLVAQDRIELRRLQPGVPVALGDQLSVTAMLVPHRDEYSDTVGFRIEGPTGALLYLPDIDKWERWDQSIEQHIARVDHALLDGTFFSGAELPGRDMSEIPHPFIRESLTRFGALPPEQRARVIFTHLNHSNPATDPGGAAAREVRRAGARVARRGERLEL